MMRIECCVSRIITKRRTLVRDQGGTAYAGRVFESKKTHVGTAPVRISGAVEMYNCFYYYDTVNHFVYCNKVLQRRACVVDFEVTFGA